jgi:hypothetical protein
LFGGPASTRNGFWRFVIRKYLPCLSKDKWIISRPIVGFQTGGDVEGSIPMPNFHQIAKPEFAKIDLPVCPKCRSLMLLTRIEPDRPGYDQRTFECGQCNNEITWIIKFRAQEAED